MFIFKQNAVVLLLNYVLLVFAQAVPAADEFTAYLFAYFTGNDNTKEQEAIRFAMSDDAHTFKALNKNNPIISSAKISTTGGIRDPHILRGENNDYYMVATDMVAAKGWASNHGIVMLKSSNLVDWESSAIDIHEHFSSYKTADRVWAPQTIYDPSAGKYMVYFAMRLGPNDKDKIYYAYADSTFTKLEAAPNLLYKYGNNPAIDADIIYKDSTYHLFFKTEQSGNGIKSALSKKVTEGYVLYDKYLQVTNAAVEGSCVFKLIDSDTYVLMYDVYTSGRYEFAHSTDLTTFTKDPKPVSFDFTPRHGTIIPITTAEKNALLAKWSKTGTIRERVPFSRKVSYRSRGKTLELNIGKTAAYREVSLVDCSGRTVLRQNVQGPSASIDVSTIPAGVYYVSWNAKSEDIGCTGFLVK